MKIVYTDENSRLRDFAEIMNSSRFRDFIDGNLTRITKWDHGMTRVNVNLCKDRINVFLKADGFELGKETKHANGIGNNNMNYVKDINSGEYIGALHLNSNLSGSVYCCATDIHDRVVSNSYSLSPHGISLERHALVSWEEYKFGMEEYALTLINDSIKVGLLQEGPNGGVMVYKEFEDGVEGWQEMKKELAAQDLVEQDKVNELFEAFDNFNSKEEPSYFRYFYSGIQDKEADAFASEMGWHKIWGSDSQGLNGDTWVVFRNISDLPKYLQGYAEMMLESDGRIPLDNQIKRASTRATELQASAQEKAKETTPER